MQFLHTIRSNISGPVGPDLAQLLQEQFGIEHTTLQVDHAPQTSTLTIEPTGILVPPDQSEHRNLNVMLHFVFSF